MIKKFFDPESENAASGGGMNIAAMMAKSGVHNDTENPVAQPAQIETEIKEPQQKIEVANAATATETSNSNTATPETPSQQTAQESAPSQEKKETAPTSQPQTLQEVLRNHKPEQVLNELGFDDSLVSFVHGLKSADPKMVAFFNTWKDGGNVQGYLKEMTTDYQKMSAEDIMKQQLAKEYPDANERQLEVLYKREVIKAYSLDSQDPDEAEEGRLLLEAKASKYRGEFIQNQQNFLLPKPPEPKPAEVDNTAELVKKEIEAQMSHVFGSDYYKNIDSSKAISFGDGDEKFTFPVDNPKDLIEVLYDNQKWLTAIFDKSQKDGAEFYTPKTENQVLLGLVAKYGKSFLDAYALHYKSIGGNKAVEPIENAKPADTNPPAPTQAAPKNAAEAMARGGAYVNYGG